MRWNDRSGNAEPAADPAQQAVGQRHQRDEGQHHRADRHRQPHAGLRALRRRLDDIGRRSPFLEGLGDFDFVRLAALGDRRRSLGADPALGSANPRPRSRLGFGIVGHDDLGHHDPAGCRHEGGGQQVRQVLVAEQPGIGGQDRAGDAGHADRHQGEDRGRRQGGEIRPHDQRALRLADEDVRRRAERFDPADAGDPADRAADPADDALHDPEVVEDRDQRGEEDDHRQCAEREGVRKRVVGARPEQEFGARYRHRTAARQTPSAMPLITRLPHGVRSTRNAIAACSAKAGADHPQANAPAARGKREGDGEDRHDPEQIDDDR